jgi:TRAP transporter TAXI family solute receptor
MKMPKWIGLVSAGLAIAALLGGAAIAQQQLNIAIATGGTGGVYYPMGGGMANVLSKNLPGMQATARVTGGSVDNLKLIGTEQSEVAFSMVDAALDALKGEDKFKGNPVEVRTLMVLYPNRMHVVTVEGTGINKMSDLKGKRVSTGSPGSATEVMAFRVIEAAGLDKDKDMTRERLGVAESTNAIKDRKIDAYFWVGGLPTAAVTDLGATPGTKIKLIDHSDGRRQDERQIRQHLHGRNHPGQDLSGTGYRQQDLGGAEHPRRQCKDAGQDRLRHRQNAVRETRRRGAGAWRSQGDRARDPEQAEHHDPVASRRPEIFHRSRRQDVMRRLRHH